MNYHVARNGQTLGVYPAEELRLRLLNRELLPSDLCWTEGMPDWQPLSSISPGGSSYTPVFNPYSPPSVDIAKPRSYQAPAAANLASAGQRFAAVLLNALAFILCLAPLVAGAIMADEQPDLRGIGQVLIAVGIFAALAFVIYNAVLLSTRGQTLGKKWMNIRIVDSVTGENPGFVKALLLRYFVNDVLLAQFVPFYGLVDVCFIFREDRRCIHDLMAGTQVVVA